MTGHLHAVARLAEIGEVISLLFGVPTPHAVMLRAILGECPLIHQASSTHDGLRRGGGAARPNLIGRPLCDFADELGLRPCPEERVQRFHFGRDDGFAVERGEGYEIDCENETECFHLVWSCSGLDWLHASPKGVSGGE